MENCLPSALFGFRGFLQSIICIVLSVRWQINLVNIVDWCLYRLLVLWLWRGWGRWCQWKLSYTMVSSGAATDHDDHDHCSGTMIVSRAAVILIEILSELSRSWSRSDHWVMRDNWSCVRYSPQLSSWIKQTRLKRQNFTITSRTLEREAISSKVWFLKYEKVLITPN